MQLSWDSSLPAFSFSPQDERKTQQQREEKRFCVRCCCCFFPSSSGKLFHIVLRTLAAFACHHYHRAVIAFAANRQIKSWIRKMYLAINFPGQSDCRSSGRSLGADAETGELRKKGANICAHWMVWKCRRRPPSPPGGAAESDRDRQIKMARKLCAMRAKRNQQQNMDEEARRKFISALVIKNRLSGVGDRRTARSFGYKGGQRQCAVVIKATRNGEIKRDSVVPTNNM